ncbi:MAG: carbohydrate ABC transporter permease, partial [Paracoccus sp. (in: a-proteobacteria)]
LMEGMAGQKSSLTWAVNIAAFLLVLLWTIPTLGLFVSSFRDRDQISTSGWWQSFSGSEQTGFVRSGTAGDQIERDGLYVIEGSALQGTQKLTSWGTGPRNPAQYQPGEVADLGDGATLTVTEDGTYQLTSQQPFEMTRGERIFTTTLSPPSFTTDNYNRVLTAGGLGRAFMNTMTVTIPATVIPILIAAFAAY